jgi:hypothetical protein
MNPIEVGRAVISPDRVPRLCIDTENESPFERPDTCGKIDLSLVQNRTASYWPDRNETLVSEDETLGRNGTLFPNQRSVIELETIHAAIVRSENDPAFSPYRSKTNRPVGGEFPD